MREVQTLLYCDPCGTPRRKAEITVPFAFDGQAYESELCARHRRALGRLVEEIAPFARKVTAGGTARTRRRRTPESRTRSADARAWAERQGLGVKSRGRLPASVEQGYAAEMAAAGGPAR
jgi:Lsr2